MARSTERNCLESASAFDLQSFLQNHHHNQQCPRLAWMVQLADALASLHDAGVTHGDLTSANVFLDDGMNSSLADFSGSSIDSSPLLFEVTASHLYLGDLFSPQGHVFTLGAVFYKVMTGKRPYDGVSDEHRVDVSKRRLSRRLFSGQLVAHHQDLLAGWLPGQQSFGEGS